MIKGKTYGHWARRGLLHLFLMCLAVIFVFPFFWSLMTSLKPMGDLFKVGLNLWPSKFMWSNYETVFEATSFGRFYANTIAVTIARTVGGVFIAAMAGYAFARLTFRGRDAIFFLLLAGMMVPDQVLIVPRYVIMREFGWLNSYQGLVIPLLFSSFGVFLLRQFFLGIPKDFFEAAMLEGANPFQIFKDIYLPLARPALASFGFLTLLWSWNEFLWALTVTSSNDMKVLSVGIALFQGQHFTNTAVLLAAANLATFPLIIAFLFFQKQLVEGIAMTGVKG